MVWHGSSTQGTRQTDSYCETWRTGTHAVTGMASSLQEGYLLQQLPRGCSSSFIVLCIENSYIAEWTKIFLESHHKLKLCVLWLMVILCMLVYMYFRLKFWLFLCINCCVSKQTMINFVLHHNSYNKHILS